MNTNVTATTTFELPEALKPFAMTESDIMFMRNNNSPFITKKTMEGAVFELALDWYFESLLDADEKILTLRDLRDNGQLDLAPFHEAIREEEARLRSREDIVGFQKMLDSFE